MGDFIKEAKMATGTLFDALVIVSVEAAALKNENEDLKRSQSFSFKRVNDLEKEVAKLKDLLGAMDKGV